MSKKITVNELEDIYRETELSVYRSGFTMEQLVVMREHFNRVLVAHKITGVEV